MSQNLVSLTVNPCKMCMPMGAATAFYGIEGCVSILHGSQGCSTYIRRHMATHYNEPVDIASSSLTEHGTVFGGAENLMKGLENLIEQYHPQVIGVATTCLAETIGEDVPRIVKEFCSAHPKEGVKIIPVSTPGYSGTQFEGFFAALRAVVEYTDMLTAANHRVNIITGPLSPADTRYLKALLTQMGIDYILLPDLSDRLDGVHASEYARVSAGGTALGDISQMAGARMTIELSAFVPEKHSPGGFLNERYGVPLIRLPLPVGLSATDALINTLKQLGGVVPEPLRQERGRFVDAMIDSHKYNAAGRAAVFGEPDLVQALVSLCCENGVMPVLTATGSVCKALEPAVLPQIKTCADALFVNEYTVLDDTDFDTIEGLVQKLGANLLIGSSDGRRVTEKHGMELIRCGFPIHDRIGGQRVRMLGYEGSLSLLDQITNALLAKTEGGFRKELYNKYYQPEALAKENEREQPVKTMTTEEKTAAHPCYNCGAGNNARIHLPVAPACNIQCNYCVRKYDCPNESRPGVTTEVLTPKQAYEKYAIVKAKMENLTVVGIAGPGDALADFEKTRETLTLIREYDPNVVFCLSTNGLLLPLYAQELINLGVTHVTVTVNAVSPAIGAKIYSHVDYMGTRYTGETAAAILMANQLTGIQYLTGHGVVCKVNTVVLKGINDTHIEDVVKRVKALGVYITNIMQLIPVKGSAFEAMPLVSNREITELRKQCALHVKQMYHCRQCRADAIGTLENDLSIEYRGCTGCGEEQKKAPLVLKTYAVASKSGVLVDQHFGYAEEFYIYESDGNVVRFKEKRKVAKYCAGPEQCDEKAGKIDSIVSAVSDCDAVLALRIGVSPSDKLRERGIRIYTTYDRIEDAVRQAAAKAI